MNASIGVRVNPFTFGTAGNSGRTNDHHCRASGVMRFSSRAARSATAWLEGRMQAEK